MLSTWHSPRLGHIHWHIADGCVTGIVVYGDRKIGTLGRLIIAGEGVSGICALKLSGGQIAEAKVNNNQRKPITSHKNLLYSTVIISVAGYVEAAHI